jgi:hypothetical protein
VVALVVPVVALISGDASAASDAVFSTGTGIGRVALVSGAGVILTLALALGVRAADRAALMASWANSDIAGVLETTVAIVLLLGV